MTTSRTFRLFISSTFSDMAHERRILHEKVFPKLSQLCASHGAQFQAVDLRWGVNEDSQLDHKTMDICLGEIERCQRLSPKPNFLALLGDRYGWEPVPARSPSSEFDALRAKANAKQGKLLDQWYIRDDNAVPPHHALKRRDENFDEYHEWAPEEERLREVVRELVDKAGLEGESRDKYFQSATHQEIARGALSLPMVPDNTVDPAEHVLACFRNIDSLPQEPNTFFDDHSEQLTALKEQLRSRLAETDKTTDNVYEYEASWRRADTDDIALTDEPAFAARVLAHFTRVITAELDGLEEIAPLEAEQQAQQAFRNDRCRHFAGREQTLGAIDAYLDGDENRVMAIIGPGGSGKSALMAQATKRVSDRPGLLSYRFIGATPASTLIDSVLRSVAEELAQVLGNTEPLPTKREELVEQLVTLMGQATAEQPITVVLDALDQLTEAEARKLEWLPEELPAHAKFIVSALPDLQAPLSKTHHLALPQLSNEAGSVILDAWLAEAGRTLQPEQRAAVLDGFKANGLPLYLKLAFERARSWGPTEGPADLPTDIDGMVESMLDALEADHTPSKITKTALVLTAPLVQRALGLLQAARYGLAEHELLDALSQDREFFEAYEKTLHHALPENRLPVAVWSRMYLDLEPYLVEREAQGVVVLGFFHRQVGEVIGQRYGEGDAARQSHVQLAAYFGGQENFLDDDRKQPNGRRLGELPHQLLHAEKWKALEATLTDFDLLMATCQAGLSDQLIGDYRDGWDSLRSVGHMGIQLWEEFLRTRAHILARPDPRWGSEKIMLQLAIEHADDSPVTMCAESWLNEGRCDWLWLRRIRRVPQAQPSPCLRVLEGHADSIDGAVQLDDDRVVTASADGTLRLWSIDTGACLQIFDGHRNGVVGVVRISGDRLLSWSLDGTARIWCSRQSEALVLMDGRPEVEQKAPDGLDLRSNAWNGRPDICWGGVELTGGRIVTWLDNGTLHIWENECLIAALTPHEGRRRIGVLQVADRVLSWSRGVLHESSTQDGALLGRMKGIRGVRNLPGDRVLVWGGNSMAIYHAENWKLTTKLERHGAGVRGTRISPEGHIISWDSDGLICAWSNDGVLLGTAGGVEAPSSPSPGSRSAIQASTTSGHTPVASIRDALALGGGLVVTWADRPNRPAGGEVDTTLRVWDTGSGECRFTLTGHTDQVWGARALEGNRLLSWSWDTTLRVWCLTKGEELVTLLGHTGEIQGAETLSDGRILSWAEDGCARVWRADPLQTSGLLMHEYLVSSVKILGDCVLSRGTFHRSGVRRNEEGNWVGSVFQPPTPPTDRLWSSSTGRLIGTWPEGTPWPQSLIDEEAATKAGLKQGLFEGRARGAVVSLVHNLGATHWHGHGLHQISEGRPLQHQTSSDRARSWTAGDLGAGGTLVATCNRDVAILKLYHGNQRVTLNEAAAILGPPMDEVPT